METTSSKLVQAKHRWLLLAEENTATCGGLIKDHDSNFVQAWSTNLGNCSVTAIELWGVLLGLQMANFQIRNVWLKIDSKCVFQFISIGVLNSHVHAPS